MSAQRARSSSQRSTQTWQADRIEVVQALLNQPFVSHQRDPDLYNKARDHYVDLRNWFHEQAGWSLIMTRQFVKLEKVPVVWQPWMRIDGLRDGRDYGLFCFGLWYLEGLGEGDQFLLSELVEAIREHLYTVDVAVDWTMYDHRLAMSRALKKLRDLDVITTVEGDESDWARAGEQADVLYEASPLARYVLRRFPRDLMSYEHIADLQDLYEGAGAAGSNESAAEAAGVDSESAALRTRRHRVMRRLLQEPMVYDWQWDEASRRYVQTQRASLIDRMQQWTGLAGRRYKEGLVFTWPELTGQMDLFPTQGTISDIVLLLAGELRRVVSAEPHRYERDENSGYTLTQSELEGLMVALRARHNDWWSKEYREMTSSQLTVQVLDHLVEWNLGGPTANGAVLYPGLLRWNGHYETEAEGFE